jgi:hypothetical protein
MLWVDRQYTYYYFWRSTLMLSINLVLRFKNPCFGRYRPGPPRILPTLELVHRISSVSRGLAPFPLDIPILNRLLKGHLMNGGFVIPVVLKRRFKRRSSMVDAWDIV